LAEIITQLAAPADDRISGRTAEAAGRDVTPLPSMVERHLLLVEWCDTARTFPGELLVPELIARRARSAPAALAVADGRHRLTYGELEERANGLAHRLRGLGVGPEVLVALLGERSAEMVAGALAVLRAGGCYLPLDSRLPRERLAFVLEDSRAVLVLVEPRLAAQLPAGGPQVLPLTLAEMPRMAAPPAGGALAGNLAYTIFTSGSTGRPKGVEVEHASLARLVRWHQEAFPFGPGDRMTQFANLAFDVSVWEIWSCLASGASLHVPDEETRASAPRMIRWLAEQEITFAFLSTQLVELALDEPWPAGMALGTLTTAGDRLHCWPGSRLPCPLYNLYGPTEATVYATGCALPPAGERDGLPPIGRPLANSRIYLLDEALQPVPLGDAGELWIGGGGLARGYLGRPELTAERFVPDPFAAAAGGRMYRTGDLARYLPDGNIDFLGRADFQLKIRGFRIEPGEVEAALLVHPAVREAVVVARADGPAGPRLVAYFVPSGPAPESAELRRHLDAKLPDYMVPSAFVVLPELPLNPSGKIDRRSLAERPESAETGAAQGIYLAPRTLVEEALAEVWAELLGLARVGIRDSFVHLGGHSLLGVQVLARVQRLFGVELTLRTLLEAPTVEGLAREVAAAVQAAAAAAGTPVPGGPEAGAGAGLQLAPVPRDRELPLSFAQQRLWFLDRLQQGSAAYNVPAAWRLRGRLAPPALAASLAEIVRRHEALRTRFAEGAHGPVQVIAPPAAGFRLPEIDLERLPEAARRGEQERLAKAEAARPFDLESGPLLRARLLRIDGGEWVLVLCLHHIVSDGWSMGVLYAELGALYGALASAAASDSSGAPEGAPLADGRRSLGKQRARPERRELPVLKAQPELPELGAQPELPDLGALPALPELPELPVQYADYAVWQRQWLQGEVLERQLAYWRERLAGQPPILELPADRPRPAVQTLRGAVAPVLLGTDLTAALKALSRQRAEPLFMTVLAGFLALLHRYTGEVDLVVGTPSAGRTRVELESLIGFFVNTLVLRTGAAGDPAFSELIGRAREVALEAYAHGDLPLERIVEELAPERSLAHSPLFQVAFALQTAPAAPPQLPGLEAEPLPLASGTAKFDLTVSLAETAAGLGGEIEYSRDLFDETTARRMADHLRTLLAGAAADPRRRLSALPLLCAAERRQLVVDWNATRSAYAGERSLHGLFAEQARRTPGAVAVTAEGESITYGELAARARAFAARLRAAGVGVETPVALCVERSLAMVVGTLAILEAGGAYLPLDPSHPPERLAFLLADSAAPVLLTQQRLAATLPAGPARVILLDGQESAGVALTAATADAVPTAAAGGDSLAYVIYTSGSTGRPKGVAVSHRAVLRLVCNTDYLTLAPGARVAQTANASFDAAVFELWAPLLHGGTLVILPQEVVLSPPALADAIRRQGIDTLFLTTALLNQVAREAPGAFAPLAALLFGGEAVDPGAVRALLGDRPPRRLLHLYGPTENTTFSTWFEVREVAPGAVTVPIGKPIANSRAYVLDASLRPVPVGVHGSLYVGGDGLARGYLNRPDLTAARFVPDPFAGETGDREPMAGAAGDGTAGAGDAGDAGKQRPGGRLYATGDLVRQRPDGHLEFLGRVDQQVKIRGFRIEPGEIEAVLAAHPRVQEAVVLARDAGAAGKQLVAYVAAGGAALDVEELREHARSQLPDYMVPSAFVVLPALPLTPNGKLDRQALARRPELAEIGPAQPERSYVAPRTATEDGLAALWAQLLGLERVGIRDDFFRLGGHSLLAARVLSRVRRQFGVEISIRTLFESTTVEGLARCIEERQWESDAAAGAFAGGSDVGAPAPSETGAAAAVPLPARPDIERGRSERQGGGQPPLPARPGIERGRSERQGGGQPQLRARPDIEPDVRGVLEAPIIEAPARPLDAQRQRQQRPAPAAPPLRPLPPSSRTPEARLPLSFAQQRLWFLDQMEPGALYNVPAAYWVEGAIDVAALASALAAIVRRHQALRTRFVRSGDEPAQVIAPADGERLPALALVDLSPLPAARRAQTCERLAREDAARPFDLARGPVARFTLVRLAQEEHALLLAIHHIVSDGWSLVVLMRELATLYGACSAGVPSALPALTVQYADYAAWQRAWMQGEALAGEVEYWRRRLAGAPAVLDLPADRPRPAAQSFRGGLVSRLFPRDLAASIESSARDLGGTPFILLMAAFQALLGRYTRQPEISVGTPIAGRNHLEIEGLIGFFVNTLVLRTSLAGNPSFTALAGRVREAAVEAQVHQDLPFEKLVEALEPERSLSHTPLFQTMLVFQNDSLAFTLPGLRLHPLPTHSGTAKFDLVLEVVDQGDGLESSLEYSRDLFDETTAARMLRQLWTLLEGALAAPERRLWDLPLLTPGERAQLVTEWNDSAAPVPQATERQRFAAQARRIPGAVAVSFRGMDLTYAEVEARATRLARLLGRHGIAPGVPVGICLERSLAAPVALLAVLEAGGVYLPLDPSYPADRLAFMLADAGAPLLLTDRELAGRFPDFAGRVLCLEAIDASSEALETAATPGSPAILPSAGTPGTPAILPSAGTPGIPAILSSAATPGTPAILPSAATPGTSGIPPTPANSARDRSAPRRDPAVGPQDLAYLIYTSGSTGRPKGIAMTHLALANLVDFHLGRATAAAARTLQFSPASFDVSLQELFTTWAAGGALVLVSDEDRRDPEALLEILERERISRLCLPFVALHHLAEAAERLGAAPSRLREVITAGEQLRSTAAITGWIRRMGNCTLENQYGPSELHVVTALPLPPDPGEWAPLPPIGRPTANSRAYVLDASLQPVPIGVPGELFLGGAQIARGYLGRPDLTAERFVPDHLGGAAGASPGDRLYRSGDLARWLADGNLEFLGRADGQVKVRGFRIELGEIETVLAACPGVRQAAVLAVDDRAGGKRLVAYVAPAVAAEDMRVYLQARLPEYMVPSAFGVLPALPLTPSGKVDRRALAAVAAPEAPAPGQVAPRTLVEKVLAAIWEELLEREAVGIRDDFFQLGGHSLLATQVLSRVRRLLGVELGVRVLFELPTVEALARQVELARGRADSAAGLALVPLPRDRDLPLSFAQQRLWFLDRLQPGSSLYNLPVAYRLRGRLVPALLAASLGEIVRRHEALRTRIVEGLHGPQQEIDAAGPVVLPRVDLGHLPEPARRGEERRLTAAAALRPFDLARGPLLRLLLMRQGESEWVLVMAMHHVVSDGWSVGVLLSELAALYGGAALPELPLQYADYAAWQRKWLQGEALELQLAYWRERLADQPPVLELPTDRPRPPVQTFRGATETLSFEAEASRRLRDLGRKSGAPLFMTALATFVALLHRYTGQTDLVVGSPSAGRGRVELEGLIGFFVNSLVLRVDAAGDPPFAELLARTRATALGAYVNGDLPFERLVEELAPERSLGHSPLFQVMFVLQTGRVTMAPRLGGMEIEELPLSIGAAKFDLTVALAETAAGLGGEIEYNRDLFDETTARRMADHFRTLLAGAAADPGCRLSALPLLSAAERRQLVVEWNATRSAYAGERSLHGLFAEQARRTPGAVAVTAEGESVTYGELAARARAFAARLRAAGVGVETPVALCVERSLAMVVGALAILEAGGAYLPLDPSHPRERLAFLLADSAAPVLLTQQRLAAALPAGPARVILLDGQESAGVALTADTADAAPTAAAGGDSLAYVIYTSGSTGRPKGVAVSHRAVLRLVCNTDYLTLAPGARVAQTANASFDAAVFELWAPLLHGGTLVILPQEVVLSPPALADAIRRQGIDTLFLTTALLNQVAREAPGAFAPLAALLFGGEAVDPGAVRALLGDRPPRRLLHLYGPTENTTFSTWFEVREVAPGAVTVPIGKPIANSRAYVLDASLRPVPVGVHGSLYVGGDGLARGYLNRPDLTAARFVPDPFAGETGDREPMAGAAGDGTAGAGDAGDAGKQRPGGRLYATGDLVRQRPDGHLEFLGRVDQQVKIRGFRIEPGEIEAVLAAHPRVQEAVVLARDAGAAGKQLVAYVAAGGAALDAEELREHARSQLPDYMVPSAFVVLPALPLTPNGKLDRQALPTPDRPPASAVAPRTPLEELLAGIFCEVFGLPAVGVHDNFFALGGHSLLATRVASRVRRGLGIELDIRSLFEAPTVASLARRLEARHYRLDGSQEVAAASSASPLRAAPHGAQPHLPLSFAQQRLWFLDQLEPGSPLYSVPVAFRVEGRLEVTGLAGALAEIVRRHVVLRTSFFKVDGEPVQVISPRLPAPLLPLMDLEALPAAARAREIRRLAQETVRRPFDLVRGPLVRFALARLAVHEHAFFLAMHHIVSDAWSMEVLLRELAALYGGFLAAAPARLPALPVQYADYAIWQREWLRGEVLEREVDYWRNRLGPSAAVLDLPADRPRPAVQSYRGGVASWRLPSGLAERLAAAAREMGGTPFIVLMAAFQALLCRCTQQLEINVGTPIAGRTRVEVEGLIGFFVNTLVLRTSLAGNPTFAELVARVREVALEAHAHQDLPFEKLVEALEPERSLSHSPLFQVMLTLHNNPLVFTLPGLRISPIAAHGGTAKFDLLLALGDEGDGLAGAVEYNADLFDGTTVARLLEQLETLLGGALDDSSRRLWQLPMLSEAARAQLLVEWNDSAAPALQATQHERFAAQARRLPQQVALSFRGVNLTYAATEERANRLANLLVRSGIGTGAAVGVCLERSLELPVVLLAILKAGGVFVPLDPTYPADRLAFMLADSAAKVLLTQEKLAGLLPGFAGEIVLAEALDSQLAREPSSAPDVPVSMQDLAYVVYTSGSTGRPKGIGMTHGALANLVEFHLAHPTGAEARTLQFAPASFDVVFQEMFSTWAAGGTLVMIADDDRRDAATLLRILDGERIGRLFLPFVALNQLAEAAERLGARPAHLRQVITAGEQLQSTAAIGGWFRRLGDCTLENQYGPSESHVVTSLRLPLGPGGWAPLPAIGRPIPNLRLYILDPYLQPVPIGVPGEIFLGGAQLARGYLGRPDLTAERFLPDHLGGAAGDAGGGAGGTGEAGGPPGGRLYRTGDLARWLADGNVEFLGRIDLQVKVRGFRIELGEIEAVLAEHPAVREAVVAAPEVGRTKRLVAYFVPAGEGPGGGELKAYLEERLPAYMVPSHFVRLDALPLGATGKVDRRALPAPEAHRLEGGEEFVAPRTPLEELVAQIWAEVLHVDRVGIHDNFWDLGGHSLLATKALARVNEALDVELPLQSLFKSPTIVGFTAAIGDSLLEDENAVESNLMAVEQAAPEAAR
jgi:amino acid adenylation domain-containing protein